MQIPFRPLVYFKESEFRCKCGCGGTPKPELMLTIDQIRKDFGHPIVVRSAQRCPARNKLVGGAPKSAHVEGLACDMVRTPELLAFLEANLEKYHIRLEHPDYTPSWIHVDLRPVKSGRSRIFKP